MIDNLFLKKNLGKFCSIYKIICLLYSHYRLQYICCWNKINAWSLKQCDNCPTTDSIVCKSWRGRTKVALNYGNCGLEDTNQTNQPLSWRVWTKAMLFKVVLVTSELSGLGEGMSTQLFTTSTLETMSYTYYNGTPSNPTLKRSKTLETSLFQETV